MATLLIIPGFFTDIIGLFIDSIKQKYSFKLFLKNKKDETSNIKTKNRTIDGEILNKDKDEL